MATPENKVKAEVKKALIAHGVYPFADIATGKVTHDKVQGAFYMPVAGPFSVHGVHDFVGCWDGLFFSIETKAPKEVIDATEHQERFRFAFSLAGGATYVGVRDASAVVDLYARVLARKLEKMR